MLVIVPIYLLIFDDEYSEDGVTYIAHEVTFTLGSAVTRCLEYLYNIWPFATMEIRSMA